MLNNSAPTTDPVRIVGIIGGGDESSSRDSNPWIIQQSTSSQRVTISLKPQFTSRNDSYELDYCYQQNEGTSVIYTKELRHLIPDMINGTNVTVIAYGARNTGKTQTLKGSEGNPGLVSMAMEDILSKTEENGYSVSISMYEVYHQHVLDLLDSNRTQVQVLEDAQGRVNLKGLSTVLVKSMEEFTRIFSKQHNPVEPRRRCHNGLIVYISSLDGDNKLKLASKMNFVDLAGYEDSRRNDDDGLEITKINKSLYGLYNVVHAIKANDNHVPYRENKLARLLKESITRNNHILMLNCLNPYFCQDTIHTVSLASRSCQRKAQMLMDSKKGTGSASKVEGVSSTRKERPVIPLLQVREHSGSNQQSAAKKASSISKERRIRNEVKTMKLKSPLRSVSAIKCKPLSGITPSMITSQEKAPEVIPMSTSETLLDDEHDFHVSNGSTHFTSLEKEISKVPYVIPSGENSDKDVFVCQDVKENISFQTVGNVSPPLSEQIKTISENLKALCASAPSSFKLKESEQSCPQVDVVEPRTPRTPVMQHHVKIEDRFETPKYNTPSQLFHMHSSGMKQSMVQEYLKFLNTASKEELKELKGIGEKRSTYILELRETSPEPFKNLDDLENIGLSAKQIKGMVKNMGASVFIQ